MDYPADVIDGIITMLHRLQKFHPRTGHEGLSVATLPHEKKPCTYCTRGWGDPKDSLDW